LAFDARAGAASPPAELRVEVPLHLQFPSLRGEIEKNLPSKIAAEGAWTMSENQKWGFKYFIERDPISVEVRGSRLAVSAQIRYRVKACKRTKKPWPFKGYICPTLGSCGYDHLVAARVSADVDLTTSSNWSLQQKPANVAVSSGRCRVTVLGIDASRRIEAMASARLRDAIDRAASSIAQRVSARPRAEEVWARVARTSELEPKVWLALAPVGAGVTTPVFTDTTADATLALHASPRLELRSVPPEATAPPLPSLTREPNATGSALGDVTVTITTDYLRESIESAVTKSPLSTQAKVDSVVVTSAATGVHVTLTLKEPPGVTLRARLKPKLEGDRLEADVEDVEVDGVGDALRPKLESAARRRLAEMASAPRGVTHYLLPVARNIRTLPIGGDKEIAVHITDLEPQDVVTDAEGIKVRVATKGSIDVRTPPAQPTIGTAVTGEPLN